MQYLSRLEYHLENSLLERLAFRKFASLLQFVPESNDDPPARVLFILLPKTLRGAGVVDLRQERFS